jgi:hypothetical protein
MGASRTPPIRAPYMPAVPAHTTLASTHTKNPRSALPSPPAPHTVGVAHAADAGAASRQFEEVDLQEEQRWQHTREEHMQAGTEARLEYAPVTPAQSLYHQSYQEARLLTRAIREEVAVGVGRTQLEEAHSEERDRMCDEGVSRSGGGGGGVVLPLLADDATGRGTLVLLALLVQRYKY